MPLGTTSAPDYRMPAEWEPHEAVWLQWPEPYMRGYPGYARKMQSTWLEMTSILADHVTVRIAASNAIAEEAVARDCERFGANMRNVEVYVVPVDDVWVRDVGPVFVKGSNGELVATDWNFNGWGEPAAEIERDRNVAAAIAALLRLKREVGGIVGLPPPSGPV